MSDPRAELSSEEVMWIGLRTALMIHFCGCLYLLIWIAWRTANLLFVFGCFMEMCISVAVPLVIAAGVAELVEHLRRRFHLPIPLFTRACVILGECLVLGWVVVLVSEFAPFGGDIQLPDRFRGF